MSDYTNISEIVDPDSGKAHPPLEEWKIDVLERGLSENLGDLGGREEFVANARVRVTEQDGSSWEGLAHLTE